MMKHYLIDLYFKGKTFNATEEEMKYEIAESSQYMFFECYDVDDEGYVNFLEFSTSNISVFDICNELYRTLSFYPFFSNVTKEELEECIYKVNIYNMDDNPIPYM